MSRPIGTLAAVSLDCPDPAVLAEFYTRLLGWEVVFSSDDFTYLAGKDFPVRLSLQRVPDHKPPSWPSSDKQFHLDLSVDNLDDAEKAILEAGGSKPEFQPGGDKWRVLQDPAGHPFCVTTFKA
ncbi:VOC family protein [Micromonospora sp. NPDC018662]|uniref:VOC family protein n=1 Tax=Micromonospora sp. NPDC018662 TaxID=3364238 RepID=UPI0037B1FC64